ncbi:MAG: DUF2612 domain-containing protein [Bacteroidales bacterium]|nr:DUF2612 domain-containing protein [Bacteroidales bacterium]
MFREQTLNVLQQQYGYTNISDLVTRKADLWDKYMGNIAERFVSEILDYNTCIPAALDYYWGPLLKITRNFTDDYGNVFTLTDEQFREVLKIRAFGTTWDGTVATLNAFLANLFAGRGNVYMVDRQDMTAQIYVFTFRLEPWEQYLFTHRDVLPRCAGVGTAIYEITQDTLFGFENEDNNWQPFNEGTFWLGQLIY